MSHVVTSTLSLLSKGLIKFPKILTAVLLIFKVKYRLHVFASTLSHKNRAIIIDPLAVSIDAQKAYLKSDYSKSKGTQLKLSTSHDYGTQPKINRTTHAKGI